MQLSPNKALFVCSGGLMREDLGLHAYRGEEDKVGREEDEDEDEELYRSTKF